MKLKIKDAAREFKNWSLYKLAQMLDVPSQTVYAWSWGKAFPSYKSLEKICNLLECTPNDLLDLDTY